MKFSQVSLKSGHPMTPFYLLNLVYICRFNLMNLISNHYYREIRSPFTAAFLTQACVAGTDLGFMTAFKA